MRRGWVGLCSCCCGEREREGGRGTYTKGVVFRHIRLWLLGNSGGIKLTRPVGGIEIAELIPKMPMSDVKNWLRKQILISSPLSCVQGFSVLHKLSFKVWFFSSYT